MVKNMMVLLPQKGIIVPVPFFLIYCTDGLKESAWGSQNAKNYMQVFSGFITA